MRQGSKYLLAGLFCWCLTLAGTVPVYAANTSPDDTSDHGEAPVHEEKPAMAEKSEHGEMPAHDEKSTEADKSEHGEMPAHEEKSAEADKSEHGEMPAHEEKSAEADKSEHGEMPVHEEKSAEADKSEHGEMPVHDEKSAEADKSDHGEMPADGKNADASHDGEAEEGHDETASTEHGEADDTEHGKMAAEEHEDADHGDTATDGHGEANADGHGETSADGHGEEHAEGEEGEHKEHEETFETSYDPLPEGEDQPWRLLRRIQLLQDKIAVGAENALPDYRAALIYASQSMLADDSIATWSHERNVTAAATYLLIGGNPAVGKHAFVISPLSAATKKPLGAALSYVERRYVRANRLLFEINTDRLPNSARGQFALIKAMVTSSTDIKQATLHLEQARRYAPGTLTEEAALRRLIRIAGGQVETKEGAELLLRYSSSYFRHFSHSIYVTDFLRSYGVGVVRALDDISARALQHLKDFFPHLKPEHQMFLIATVARNAVVLGKIDLGRWASSWLLEHVGNDRKLRARIELYEIATSILDPKTYAESAVRLEEVEPRMLGKQDKRLFLALRKMSDRIGSQPVDVERLKELSLIENQSFPGDEPVLPFDVAEQTKLANKNKLLRRTRKLFSRAEQLLDE